MFRVLAKHEHVTLFDAVFRLASTLQKASRCTPNSLSQTMVCQVTIANSPVTC